MRRDSGEIGRTECPLLTEKSKSSKNVGETAVRRGQDEAKSYEVIDDDPILNHKSIVQLQIV